MTAQTPGCGSNSNARKRREEATAPTARPVASIRGDWDGSERDLDSVLRARVREIAAELLTRRAYWASRPGEIDAARAVAYQSAAGLLQRALEDTQ